MAKEISFDEARLLAQNSHKHIVRFIGLLFEELGSDVCTGFVMELMEIGNLSKVIHDSNREYDILQPCRWIEMIASAVDFLHDKGIIHRDINPYNILLGQDLDDLKLADLGVATSDENNIKKSREIGFPSYMAPEVMTQNDYSKPADVYSFGITVWEIFYRKEPYSDLPTKKNRREILKHVAKGGRPQLDDSFPMLSEFLKKTWDHNPNNRVSIAEFTKFAETFIQEQIKEAETDASFDINDPMSVKMKIYELQVIEKDKMILQLREELAKARNDKADTLIQQVAEIKDLLFSRQQPFSIFDQSGAFMKRFDQILDLATAKQSDNQLASLKESIKVLISKVDGIAQSQEESKRAFTQQVRQNISALTSAPIKVLSKQSEFTRNTNAAFENKTLPSLKKKVEIISKINEDLASSSEIHQITNNTEENSTLIAQEIGVYSAPMPESSTPRFKQTAACSSLIPQGALSSSRLNLSASSRIPKPSPSRLNLNNVWVMTGDNLESC